jgi:hypothetical protein
MTTILKGEEIPYEDLALDLFPRNFEQGQQFIPFLGAGVSISARNFGGSSAAKPKTPENNVIDQAISGFDLSPKGKTLVAMAIKLAYLIDLAEKEAPPDSAEVFLETLQKNEYPPTAGELAQLFSLRSRYTSFSRIREGLRNLFKDEVFPGTDADQLAMLQLLARVTRIANPPEPLTSIASYYEELRGRKKLWELLANVISDKQKPTPAHQLFAKAAHHHLKLPPVDPAHPELGDYLIITTNYDTLMETALDELKVPYVVLTTKRKDPKVVMRCSELVNEREQLCATHSDTFYPKDFTLSKSQNLVVIHKIHGCLSKDSEFAQEGLVISDNDYVDYVSQMAKSDLIPAHVFELMWEKPMWFLGYSLSDWNVRSIYETIKSKCNPDGKKLKDYSVMYSVGVFESLFFGKNDIAILQASLNDFVTEILKYVPEGVEV